MKEKIIEHLSKSSAKVYLDCPFKFYNHQICKIKGPTPYVFRRGGAIHDTLHESIVENVRTIDFPSQVNFAKAVFEKLKPYSIVVAEKRMEAYYQDMKLVGLMDIVVKSGSKIIIFDYKSGNENPINKYRYELAVYDYILNMNDVQPTHWGIIFVDKQIVKVEEVSSVKVAQAIGKTYQVWSDIKERKFDRKMSGCRWCDLKKQCDNLWYQYQERLKNQKTLV